MTENMQATGLEVDHVAAKSKKSKKTAATAAGLTQLRRDQERWERADTSIPVKKSRSKRSDHPVMNEGKSHPKQESVDISTADSHREREIVPAAPPLESSGADMLEAMMGWLQNEIDAVHGQIERYRTALSVRLVNKRISKKEAKRLFELLDIRLAELDEIIRLGNEGEHDQEVIERLRVLQNDLDVRKHDDEVPGVDAQPESPRVEHGFAMAAGVEIADAEQSGSRYRIERVEGDMVSCTLLTHDTNYVGTLVFDRNDPKNAGRFSQGADQTAAGAASLEESVSVEAVDRSEEWQQLLAGCTKDVDTLLSIMTDSAAQLVELLSEEMGDGFDQVSQRACVSAYLDQVLARVGNIALAADRDRAIDIVMQRISKNVLQ